MGLARLKFKNRAQVHGVWTIGPWLYEQLHGQSDLTSNHVKLWLKKAQLEYTKDGSSFGIQGVICFDDWECRQYQVALDPRSIKNIKYIKYIYYMHGLLTLLLWRIKKIKHVNEKENSCPMLNNTAVVNWWKHKWNTQLKTRKRGSLKTVDCSSGFQLSPTGKIWNQSLPCSEKIKICIAREVKEAN